MTSSSPATAQVQAGPVANLLWVHQRFGKPQVYAVLLLGIMLCQGVFLASRIPLSTQELSYVHGGEGEMGVLEGSGMLPASPQLHSPLVGSLARLSVPAIMPADADSSFWRVMLRLPFLFVGSLLGASLWYVSRRLYGNLAGYAALTLFVFSAPVLLRSCTVAPDILAAWGTFGCVFTGIAVAHTLYAPREVVLWNWRRILLLGVSIGVATASAFITFVAIPLALVFMWYLVPHRRRAALAILLASCVIGAIVLLAAFHFDLARVHPFMRSGFLSTGTTFFTRGVGIALGSFLMSNGPAFAALFLVSIAVYIVCSKARFFGTTAPLLTAIFLVFVAVTAGHRNVMVLLTTALPFLCVFMAGIVADLLEVKNRWSGLTKATVLAVLCSHALFSISGLVRLL